MKQKCQHLQLMKENKSTVYESIRVKKSILIRRKKELMDQYNLTEKNLK